MVRILWRKGWRSILFGAGAAASSACAMPPHAERPIPRASDLDAALEAVIDGDGGPATPAPAAALAIMIDGVVVYRGAAGSAHLGASEGEAPRAMTAATKTRVASISKMVAAMGAARLRERSLIDLDADVSEHLGWRLRHPSAPGAPIALRHLLSHTSLIRDSERYWVAAPGAIETLVEETAPFAPFDDIPAPLRAPGAWFEYANFNFGLAATAMEIAAGERFDLLMENVLFAPMGLDVGFNWSGVDAAARAQGATLYRRLGDAWRAQVDDTEMLLEDGPFFLKEEGARLEDYEIGRNGTLFSPQGGLRASVIDLTRLVDALATDAAFADLAQPVWTYAPSAPNGDTYAGFFKSYGLGVHILEGAGSPWPGDILRGHAGEAYGLYSGAWTVDAAPGDPRISFAYLITGTPGDAPPAAGERTAFTYWEEQLLDAVAAATRSVRRDGADTGG
ncbi:MAG: serine hydrolase domain-containing protein [Pseudomonadota bacterium]